MGNVVVWKPADSQVYSAQVIMEVFKAAGLPDGVINMVTCDGPAAGEVVFNHPDFAGLHSTGSTGVSVICGPPLAKTSPSTKLPRIVGKPAVRFRIGPPFCRCGQVVTGLCRGAFESRQKCSAASRAYLPRVYGRRLRKADCAGGRTEDGVAGRLWQFHHSRHR